MLPHLMSYAITLTKFIIMLPSHIFIYSRKIKTLNLQHDLSMEAKKQEHNLKLQFKTLSQLKSRIPKSINSLGAGVC